MMVLNGEEVRIDFTPLRGLLAMSGSTVGCHNGDGVGDTGIQ